MPFSRNAFLACALRSLYAVTAPNRQQRFPHPITQEAVNLEATLPAEFGKFELVRDVQRRCPSLKRLLYDEPVW